MNLLVRLVLGIQIDDDIAILIIYLHKNEILKLNYLSVYYISRLSVAVVYFVFNVYRMAR